MISSSLVPNKFMKKDKEMVCSVIGNGDGFACNWAKWVEKRQLTSIVVIKSKGNKVVFRISSRGGVSRFISNLIEASISGELDFITAVCPANSSRSKKPRIVFGLAAKKQVELIRNLVPISYTPNKRPDLYKKH